MNNAKTKLQSLGFTSGHAQLLTVAVAVFVVLFVAKSGINWKTVFVHADSQTHMLTYDEALAQAQNEIGAVNPNQDDGSAEQIALLDRSNIDGKVLGDAIGVGEIPDADQMLLPDIVNQLKINNSNNDSQAARQQYVSAVQKIENDAQITSLLADLNTDDKDTLRSSADGWNWTIKQISNVPVPPSLQKYNQDKLVYYSVIMNIAKIYAGDQSEDGLPLMTKAMISYSDKMDALQQQLNSQYNLGL